MASAKTTSPRAPLDRLSQLEDGVLGHILSFLPTKEAARAATIAKRYRHAFAGVDIVSFVEQVAYYGGEDYTFCLEATERRSKNGDLIDSVNGALLCRRRCAGNAAPPRVFRVHFGCLDEWDEAMLGQWLSYLLQRGRKQQALHLDLRLQLTVLGEHHVGGQEQQRWGADDGECPAHSRYEAHRYKLPTRLFSCVALRTLCLGGCSLLCPPERVDLPLLETLLLSSIPWADSIQRLVSRCPRLVDLTLERCGYTPSSQRGYGGYEANNVDRSYTIAVVDKHLRRLAIRCCHNLARVSVDASELTAFEYRGAVPAGSFLTLHGACKISSCTVGFCGRMVYEAELPRFRKFLEQFAGTKKLHLVSTHLGADIESDAFTSFPSLVSLRLTGYLHRGSIEALTRILQQAPSVEILTLFMKARSQERSHSVSWEHQWHELGDEVGVSDVRIPCLRNGVREMNLVHYQGHEAQRYAARLLLCNAMVLERVCVVMPRGPRELQMKLANEIKGWLVDSSTEMIFF
uniref:Uncharacterized protein n=1 Tax=Avena sativa TaxID=4498 RepID=A0ACD5Z280_AVESA